MTGPEIKPANKGTEEAYDPQGSGMEHSKVFGQYAPGVVSSGNMAHKHGAEGDHSISVENPTGMRGD